MKILPWLLGLVGLPLMTFLCATMHRGAIEQDLTQQTVSRLSAAGLPKVKTEAEGQIITLRGEVPDEATKVKAGMEAAGIWGVSEVRNLLAVVVPPAPQVPVMTPQQRTEAVSCQGKFDEFLREPINFETGRAVISRVSYPLLNRLADMAKTCPAAQFEVGGHTDPRGSLESNMVLSRRRAEAVVKYLAARGVETARITAEGYGPTKPVADNKTAAGMRQNRRTEFKVKGI